MSQLNVLLILPDSSKNPFGGMGVQAEGLISHMPSVCFIEHNIDQSGFIQLSENVENYIFILQLISQAITLPNLEILKKIDLVHSFDAATSIQGQAISKMIGKPHIMTLQLSMTSLLNKFYGRFDELVSGVELSCINAADAVIHVSHEYLLSYGMLNPNSYYLPNGIDFNKWQNTPLINISLPGRQGAKKLCYIGRYAEMKNIEGLVNANIPSNIDIYFIGGQRGGHEYYYNKVLEFESKNPNVYLLGEKHGDEKVNILKAMDAVIVPSIHEPFGIVCLEALASGCVLLSSFQSGMKEYLTEDIAINCGTTPEEITIGINKWLLLDDIEERKEKGYALCKQYSWSNAANILENIYKKVLNN